MVKTPAEPQGGTWVERLLSGPPWVSYSLALLVPIGLFTIMFGVAGQLSGAGFANGLRIGAWFGGTMAVLVYVGYGLRWVWTQLGLWLQRLGKRHGQGPPRIDLVDWHLKISVCLFVLVGICVNWAVGCLGSFVWLFLGIHFIQRYQLGRGIEPPPPSPYDGDW